MSHSKRATAGRPRDPDIDQAVLGATRDLLVERGFAGTTVEAVARAAGSGKAAVYRRWPSKTALVVAAVRDLYRPPDVPDTGTLRGDLLACAGHFTRPDERSTLVLASLLSEIWHDPELRQASYDAIGKPPAMAFVAVFERWIALGAIPSTAPIDLLTGLIPAFAFRNVALLRQPLGSEAAIELVDRVLLPALIHVP